MIGGQDEWWGRGREKEEEDEEGRRSGVRRAEV